MPSYKNLLRITFLTLLLFCTSCVKDVDMDQAEEIVIPPTAAIDLIYFDLTVEELSTGSGGNLRAEDETRLDFLDDDYIQDGLMRADFNFRFTNSFQNSFSVNFLFRTESNAITHQIRVDVPAGTTASPAIIDFTEIIDSEINRIKRSIKVSAQIDMQEALISGEGNLKLQSKGIYYFEFK